MRDHTGGATHIFFWNFFSVRFLESLRLPQRLATPVAPITRQIFQLKIGKNASWLTLVRGHIFTCPNVIQCIFSTHNFPLCLQKMADGKAKISMCNVHTAICKNFSFSLLKPFFPFLFDVFLVVKNASVMLTRAFLSVSVFFRCLGCSSLLRFVGYVCFHCIFCMFKI